MTIDEVPQATGAFRLDRELNATPDEERRLAIVEGRWAEGEIAGVEYVYLLEAVHDEAHGAYNRQPVVGWLASAEASVVCHALSDASVRDEDGGWVEGVCIEAATSPTASVQCAVVLALQHLAVRGLLGRDTVEKVSLSISTPEARAALAAARAWLTRLAR